MKICPRCKAQNQPNAQFCNNCAYKIPLPTRKSLPWYAWAGIGLLALLLGAGFVAIGINEQKEKRQKELAAQNAPPSQPAAPAPSAKTFQATPSAPPKDLISNISWNDYNKIYNVRSNSTDMQKDALWKDFEGKSILWTGTVSEVSEGTLSGLTLQIKMNSETLTSDILLNLKDEQKSKAMSLTKGQKVTFTGKLKSYGGAILPLSIDEAEIR